MSGHESIVRGSFLKDIHVKRENSLNRFVLKYLLGYDQVRGYFAGWYEWGRRQTCRLNVNPVLRMVYIGVVSYSGICW